MKTRVLGRENRLSVSAVGMGCMGFFHGYGAAPEKKESIRLIRLAYEMGCIFFDTAEGYAAGQNEELAGEALKPIRKDVVLATKLHIPDLDGKTVLETLKWHLRASMKRLQTDYVDLYYWLRVNPAVPLEEVAEAIHDGADFGYDVRRVITRFSPENMNANRPLLDMLCQFAEEKEATPAQIKIFGNRTDEDIAKLHDMDTL